MDVENACKTGIFKCKTRIFKCKTRVKKVFSSVKYVSLYVKTRVKITCLLVFYLFHFHVYTRYFYTCLHVQRHVFFTCLRVQRHVFFTCFSRKISCWDVTICVSLSLFKNSSRTISCRQILHISMDKSWI